MSMRGLGPAREGPGRRPQRGGPGPRKDLPPMPLPDGRCNPLCPHFRCLNNALTVVRKHAHGRQHRAPFCRWIGDECIGGSCQYASCSLRALLPDGHCMYAKEAKARETKLEELERELVKEEVEMSRVRRLFKRRGLIDEEP